MRRLSQLRVSRTLAFLFRGCVLLFLLLLFFYPWVDPYLFDNRRAFAGILQMHTAGRLKRFHNKQPFLFLSWFPGGHPKRAYCYKAYDNGSADHFRVLYSYATQGSTGERENSDAFCAMQQLTSLPPGISGPYDVTCDRLLIVSRRADSGWTTRYYDRHNLPQNIADVLRLAEIDLSADGRRRYMLE